MKKREIRTKPIWNHKDIPDDVRVLLPCSQPDYSFFIFNDDDEMVGIWWEFFARITTGDENHTKYYLDIEKKTVSETELCAWEF